MGITPSLLSPCPSCLPCPTSRAIYDALVKQGIRIDMPRVPQQQAGTWPRNTMAGYSLPDEIGLFCSLDKGDVQQLHLVNKTNGWIVADIDWRNQQTGGDMCEIRIPSVYSDKKQVNMSLLRADEDGWLVHETKCKDQEEYDLGLYKDMINDYYRERHGRQHQDNLDRMYSRIHGLKKKYKENPLFPVIPRLMQDVTTIHTTHCRRIFPYHAPSECWLDK